MHRTATTATLLVTVAVSAVSGCMTVQGPPPPGPSSPPPPPASEPRPGGGIAPQVMQAPAREALEHVGPPRRPTAPTTPAPARTAPAGPVAGPADPPRRAPAEPPRRREPRRPEHRAVPRPPAAVPPAGPDVCALGRAYGGWKAGSPEAAICEDVYGR
ncbi:hypothetical protein ACFYXC_25925 [Streptomyces sp. NPDC002701]|uniref:hypothetical protein n=1 Tax=Streptomyces sp. NPDC002701 TaxID=3364661 RepID=UPI003674DC30